MCEAKPDEEGRKRRERLKLTSLAFPLFEEQCDPEGRGTEICLSECEYTAKSRSQNVELQRGAGMIVNIRTLSVYRFYSEGW